MEKQQPLILDGKKLASQIEQELRTKIANFKIKPHFTIIQVGDEFSSNKYISNKMKKAIDLGIEAQLIKLPVDITELNLIKKIKKESKKTDALIVQLPLPLNINQQNVLDAVDFAKDVDGLSSQNSKLFYQGLNAITPATPKGILLLLQKYNIKLMNQKTYVIGESNLVGKPIKELLKREGGIVKSFNIQTGISGSEEADVLVVAAGQGHLVKSANVKQNAVVIDVGINSLGNNKIIGDVDFEDVKFKAKALSPVPGGVGPMTVIALMVNIVEVFEKKLKTTKIGY